VLVFDDVFTSGLTLREVARKLKVAGGPERRACAPAISLLTSASAKSHGRTPRHGRDPGAPDLVAA
jgi:hypoxanthine-guanine phosphoribosyltransferase